MNCCRGKKSKTPPPPPLQEPEEPPQQEITTFPDYKNVKHEVVLRIPGCKVHLMDGGEAIELAEGDFEVARISDESVSLATAIKVGDELQWPLTKDEPVVKLSPLQYLFSLPMKDDKPLSYGVTFLDKSGKNLSLLDSFLAENALFSSSMQSSSPKQKGGVINWKEFAPAVDDYNSVLAKAIAGGTGQIVKGIFKCSNAYVNQVQKGGQNIQTRASEQNKSGLADGSISYSNEDSVTKKKKAGVLNKSMKRARKLSKMTEKMSKAMLDVIGVASGSVIKPVVRSETGKKVLSMVPGEVVVASLDAVNKILDAAEAAERQTMAATSGAVSRMVTNKFGESAGEATEDALATAGHVAGTAWNVFKIRKAINPATSMSKGSVLKNAAKSFKPK